MKVQIYHIPNAKEASKYPFSNNNDAPSITMYGFLVRLLGGPKHGDKKWETRK